MAALQSVERDGGGSGGIINAVGVEEGPAEDSRRREETTVAVDGGGMPSGARALLPTVTVQGVDVPLDAPIIQLWYALRHPDHFLYIVVRKQG